MAAGIVTIMLCGHCYRPAVAAVYRRPAWRKLLGLPAVQFRVCGHCLPRYGRPSRW